MTLYIEIDMSLRLRAPRGLSKIHIAFGIAVGVFSGAYVYQPYYLQQKNAEESLESKPSN